jgi:hypothetical protein
MPSLMSRLSNGLDCRRGGVLVLLFLCATPSTAQQDTAHVSAIRSSERLRIFLELRQGGVDAGILETVTGEGITILRRGRSSLVRIQRSFGRAFREPRSRGP